MKHLLVSSLCLMLLAGCASSSQTQNTQQPKSTQASPSTTAAASSETLEQVLTKADHARQNWRYKQSLALYQQAAELGSSQADYWLGWHYEKGKQTDIDYELAMHHYRQSALAGQPEAMTRIGYLLAWGKTAEGFKQADATAWFRRGAERGDANAMYYLGEQYRHGRGVSPSMDKAVMWYGRAANNKHGGAAFNYAVGLKNGTGIAADDQQDYVWMSIAALLDHPEAARARDLIARFLTAEQKQQAWKQVAMLQEELEIPRGW